jgi:hypothetical protein
MHINLFHQRLSSQERGASILSLLVNLLLMGLIFGASLTHFFETSRRAYDHEIIASTQERARAILDLMSFEIRMAGSGMPLGQPAFMTAGFSENALPLLPASTHQSLTIKLNESGRNAVIENSFSPSFNSLTFNVTSAEDLEAGDTIYISNMIVGGVGAMRATVSSVSGNAVTISAAYDISANTSFPAGSTVDRVSKLVFNSPPDWSGITRDAELGAVVVAPKSRFMLSYLNASGGQVSLPLTEAKILNEVSSLILTVMVKSDRPLKRGEHYLAQTQQVVALRNLIINR